jgi:hypothetical protein
MTKEKLSGPVVRILRLISPINEISHRLSETSEECFHVWMYLGYGIDFVSLWSGSFGADSSTELGSDSLWHSVSSPTTFVLSCLVLIHHGVRHPELAMRWSNEQREQSLWLRFFETCHGDVMTMTW